MDFDERARFSSGQEMAKKETVPGEAARVGLCLAEEVQQRNLMVKDRMKAELLDLGLSYEAIAKVLHPLE